MWHTFFQKFGGTHLNYFHYDQLSSLLHSQNPTELYIILMYIHEDDKDEFKLHDRGWELPEKLVGDYGKEIKDSILIYIQAILSDRKS